MAKTSRFADLIIFEDDALIAINKPSGISSLDERSGDKINILQMAKGYWPDAQLCHRIDRDTSGMLLIAKTPESYRHMSMQFEHRKVEKVYHAVVGGTFNFEQLEIDLPIKIDGTNKVKIDKAQGKEAYTVIDTIEVFNHYTLVACRPVTGRMHQIRIHLASQNAPITNDLTYGGKPPYLSELKRKFKVGKYAEEQPMIKRFALHAYSVEFNHPDGKRIVLQAPYPKDFDVLVKLLEKYDR